MSTHPPLWFACLAALLLAGRAPAQAVASAPGRRVQPAAQPNILIVLADDLGYADIGAFGSEIHTPNLDRLARQGLRMTQFYNAGRCCPSRAALLTGLYPHQAGVGDMVQNLGVPAYQGYLSKHSATIAQLLKRAGYSTAVAGKWHVGLVPSAWAVNRGFDRSFTLQNNGSSYFNSEPLYNDGRKVTFLNGRQEITRTDTSTYLTDAITRFALQSLEKERGRRHPFFLYIAYTAPHWPIQARPEDIARYQNRYLRGWDALRRERLRRQQAQGVLAPGSPLSARPVSVPDWNSLSPTEKAAWSTRMAIYAAMVDRMDAGIGQILAKLQDVGKAANTLVLFLSDNGGSADDVRHWAYVTQKHGTPGSAQSIDSYGAPWGNVSNTPFRLFKRNTHEGGIASPFIAWFPGRIKAGSRRDEPAHLIDVLPTCLELSGAAYPQQYAGQKLLPLEGQSLLPLFTGGPFRGHSSLCWEHEGSRAIRQGRWKLVAEPGQPWELYDLAADRPETQNLAARYPARVATMARDYAAWSRRVGVRNWAQFSQK